MVTIDCALARLMFELEDWLTDWPVTQICCPNGNVEPTELASLLRPWMRDAHRVIGSVLLVPEQAGELRSLFNRALDHLERACTERAQPFADFLILLSPIEDVLTALSMAERGLLVNSTMHIKGVL
jgi:hypothetical protein